MRATARLEGKKNDELLAPFKDIRLWELTGKIVQNDNFTIIKYGDFLEMMYTNNEFKHNCDGSHYFNDLKQKIREAYVFYLLNEKSYICKWEEPMYVEETYDLEYSNYYDFYNKFLYFNIIIHKLDSNGEFDNKQILFYKTIKESKRTKIYICNEDLAPHVQKALNIDHVIFVPKIDAYLNHKQIFDSIIKILTKDCIVLTSCGFYAPYLIKELMGVRPNNTYIDVGSSFDGLYTGSRNFNWSPLYKEKMKRIYFQ